MQIIGKHQTAIWATSFIGTVYPGQFTGMNVNLERLLGQCVGAQSGGNWTMIRSFFDPIFTASQMASLLPDFRTEVESWLTRLARIHDGEHLDIGEYCPTLPLKVVGLSLYGKCLDEKVRTTTSRHQLIPIIEISQAMQELTALADVRARLGTNSFLQSHMISRIYAFLPTQANKQLQWYLSSFRSFNLRMVAISEEVTFPAASMPVTFAH